MPDFDVDFDERRRGEVIDYVTKKYGDDRVAQVVTYGTIKAKQALKDSSRVLGYPYAMGEKLTKAMPPSVMGKDITLHGIFDPSDKRYAEAEEFRQVYNADPEAQKIVATAQGLEGIKRQWGVHACAVIMSSHPLIDIIPIMRRPQDGAIITQFDYPTCEGLGLLKMDFLGLRNLTVIGDALENIGANGKEAPDLERLGLDDRKTVRAALARRHPRACSSSTAAACARCCGSCAPTTSRTSPPSAPCTARARWARTPTRTTRCARTASRRSSRSTPSSRSRSRTSWARPTA